MTSNENIKHTINDYSHYANLSTSPPGFQRKHCTNKTYSDQCLTYGFAGATAKLLDTIRLSRKNIMKWAMLDSGATSNFLMTDAHATHFDASAKNIHVTLPDGNQVFSTHRCLLDLPNLPRDARQAYVIPGLASHSLISVVTLYNAGCEVTFTKI